MIKGKMRKIISGDESYKLISTGDEYNDCRNKLAEYSYREYRQNTKVVFVS